VSDAPGSSPRPRFSIVLPSHNEEELLESTVAHVEEGMGSRGVAFEVVIVENGSTDATGRIAQEMAHRYPNVLVLTQPVGDYGAALKAGFLATCGEVVVNFDVDYFDLDFLDSAGALILAEGVDLVVASKRSPEAQDHRSPLRRLLTLGFTTLLKVMVSLPVSDAHGIKAMRRSTIAPLVERCQLTGSMFDVEMACRAGRAGLSIRELPATVVELRPVRSSVGKRAVEGLVLTIRLRRVLRRDGRVGH
jgi:hypothetical protein